MTEQGTEKEYAWNGADLRGTNGMAVLWAWTRMKRLKELGMGRGERDALIVIAGHTKVKPERPEDANVAWPEYDTIADKSGRGDRLIGAFVKRLERARVIEITPYAGPHGTAYRYRILPEIEGHVWLSVRPAKTAPVQKLHDTPAETAPLPLQFLQSTPAETATEQEYLTGVLEQENKTLATAAAVAAQTPAPKVRKTPGQMEAERIRREREKRDNAPAQTKPAAPTPADLVAAQFFGMLGKPEKHAQAAKREWPRILVALITPELPAEVVIEKLAWAVRNDYWGPAFRDKHNPAQFAVRKFEIFLSQMAAEADRNLTRPQTAAPVSQARRQDTPGTFAYKYRDMSLVGEPKLVERPIVGLNHVSFGDDELPWE